MQPEYQGIVQVKRQKFNRNCGWQIEMISGMKIKYLVSYHSGNWVSLLKYELNHSIDLLYLQIRINCLNWCYQV